MFFLKEVLRKTNYFSVTFAPFTFLLGREVLTYRFKANKKINNKMIPLGPIYFPFTTLESATVDASFFITIRI